MLRFARLGPSVRRYTQYAANNQMYIHENGTNYNVSLLPQKSALPVGTSQSKHHVAPELFSSNPAFLELLHTTIAREVYGDFSFIIEAGANANAYMPIYDFREIPRYGRTPEVDDIFGYVQVGSDGKMISNSYEANAMYRLCSGEGLMRLSDHLYEKMRQGCEAAAGHE